MNLRDAVLCIDCDEVFAIEGTPCNPRCPLCASSVLMHLSAWVQTWTAPEHGAADAEDARVKDHTTDVAHPTPMAA